MKRRTSEVMKTKSVVIPRKIQRTVLNLGRLALDAGRLKDVIVHLSDS
jgi:hypothetical protein